jgi:hypothetical protein
VSSYGLVKKSGGVGKLIVISKAVRCGSRPPTPERNFILILFGAVIVPADGTRAATLEKRRVRYVAAFVGQLSDKPLLASIHLSGVSKRIAQWRIEKLRADPI